MPANPINKTTTSAYINFCKKSNLTFPSVEPFSIVASTVGATAASTGCVGSFNILLFLKQESRESLDFTRLVVHKNFYGHSKRRIECASTFFKVNAGKSKISGHMNPRTSKLTAQMKEWALL